MIQLDSMAKREMYTKIVVCPRCGGEGCTKTWNDRERDYDREVCSECDGVRVLERIVSVEYRKIENAAKTEISPETLAAQGCGE